MRVLIVESDPELAAAWASHVEGLGGAVRQTASQSDAVRALQTCAFDVLLLDLDLAEGSAFAIADYASYRCPAARVVFVTRRAVFSDGSIFRLVPNASVMMGAQSPPSDIAAVVEHCAAAR